MIYLRGDDAAILKREEDKVGEKPEDGQKEITGADVDRLGERLRAYTENNDLKLFNVANGHEKLGHSDCPQF